MITFTCMMHAFRNKCWLFHCLIQNLALIQFMRHMNFYTSKWSLPVGFFSQFCFHSTKLIQFWKKSDFAKGWKNLLDKTRWNNTQHFTSKEGVDIYQSFTLINLHCVSPHAKNFQNKHLDWRIICPKSCLFRIN